VAVALLLLCAGVAAATPGLRLRNLLGAARLVVAAEVTTVTEYDDGRVAVLELAPSAVLKGAGRDGAAPARVAVVEMREGPTRAAIARGSRGVAFLQPAPRTSYLGRLLPPGSYYQLVPQYGAFLAADSAAEMQRQTAVLTRLVESTRGAGLAAPAARALTFELLAARNPVLVEDGAGGLDDLRGAASLSDAELTIVNDALRRTDLPLRVRVALIDAVAAAGLTGAVPVLQTLVSPAEVMAAAWKALDALGAPPSERSLGERLADRDAATRSAAARELLRRDGVDAISRVAPLALQDGDPAVRQAVIEALGGLARAEALPPLERAFGENGGEVQQTAARAILAVGGQPAADTFGRLAFSGPIEAQRYAVVLLATMPGLEKDVVIARIRATHTDHQIQEMFDHGWQGHHH